MTVRNKALNHIRDFGSKTVQLESIQKTAIAQSPHTNPPESNEYTQKLAELFKEWIQELPQRQQEAFTLSRFEGFDHEEIAEIMDVSKHTVNNHIMGALKSLRACYNEYKNNH